MEDANGSCQGPRRYRSSKLNGGERFEVGFRSVKTHLMLNSGLTSEGIVEEVLCIK